MNDSATQQTSSNANWSCRPTLKHLFYAIALLGASIAAWGTAGIVVGVVLVGAWMWVFSDSVLLGRLARLTILLAVGSILLTWWNAFTSIPFRTLHIRCSNNLKQYSLALQNYEYDHGTLPPAYVADANGKPMHSWRVLILPYVERQDIYDAYDFNQPWDSPKNLAVAKANWRESSFCTIDHRTMPPAHTSYFAVTGPGTAFPGTKSLALTDFLGQGRAPPLYLIEDHSRNVLWTEPIDLTREQAVRLLSDRERPAPHAMGEFPYGVTIRNGAFANGRMEYIRAGISAENARALVSIDDGSGASQRAMRQAVYRLGRSWWERFVAGMAFFVVLMLPVGWLRQSR